MKKLKIMASLSSILSRVFLICTCVYMIIVIKNQKEAGETLQLIFGYSAYEFAARASVAMIIGIAVVSIILSIFLLQNKKQKSLALLDIIISSLMIFSLVLAILAVNRADPRENVAWIIPTIAGLLIIASIVMSGIYLGNANNWPNNDDEVSVEYKSKAKTTAAVMAIAIGALNSVFSIISIFVFNDMQHTYTIEYANGTTEEMSTYFTFFGLFLSFLIYASILIAGIFFCNKKRNKGIGVFLITILSVFAFSFLVSTTTSTILYVNIIFAVLFVANVLAITFISIYFMNLKQIERSTDISHGHLKKSTFSERINEKIRLYKKLKEEGTLTQDEYKNAVMKEIDK